MGWIATALVGIIRLVSLIFGVAIILFGYGVFARAQNAMNEVTGAIFVLCGIVSLGIYAVTSMLDGMAEEIRKSRNGSKAVSPLDP